MAKRSTQENNMLLEIIPSIFKDKESQNWATLVLSKKTDLSSAEVKLLFNTRLGYDGFANTAASVSIKDKNGVVQKNEVIAKQLKNIDDKFGDISAVSIISKTGSTVTKTDVATYLTTIDNKVGTLSSLSTTAKTNLVAAINEVDTNADAAQTGATSALTQIGNLASLNSPVKTDLVNAMNSLLPTWKSSVTDFSALIVPGFPPVPALTTTDIGFVASTRLTLQEFGKLSALCGSLIFPSLPSNIKSTIISDCMDHFVDY